MAQDTAQSHFKELKEWSERKQKVISNYLDGASRIFGGSFVATYYVDGFAGAGLYGEDGTAKKQGSPLRAAELAQLYKDKKYKIELRCITVEENATNFQLLEEATKGYPSVKNLHGSFEDRLDDVLRLTKNYPLVCFLDPFGIKGVELATIQKLVNREAPTDIWLRFDVLSALRKWGFFKPSAAQTADAEGQRRLLKQIYGINDAQGLFDSINGESTATRQKNALELYKNQLRNVMGSINKGNAYVESYRIGSLDEDEKYHLIFGCNHVRAIALASDIVYNVEEVYQEQVEDRRVTATGQYSLLALPESKDALSERKLQDLEREIERLCKGKRMTFLQVHGLLISSPNRWFGLIKKNHVQQAVKNLQERNAVVVKGRLPETSCQLEFA